MREIRKEGDWKLRLLRSAICMRPYGPFLLNIAHS